MLKKYESIVAVLALLVLCTEYFGFGLAIFQDNIAVLSAMVKATKKNKKNGKSIKWIRVRGTTIVVTRL